MNTVSRTCALLGACALLAAPAWGGLSAQELPPARGVAAPAPNRVADNANQITVRGSLPDDLTGLVAGPELDGFIAARRGDQMQVTAPDGTSTMVRIAPATEIRARSGFLGIGRTQLGPDSLLNGLPVSVQTVVFGEGLVASRVRFTDDDLETAAMIRGATAQRFAEHDVAIEENAAATEALRGRVGDIDQYNIRGTTNVYFDTGRWQLTPASQAELCEAAREAGAMNNALLLVVGYTDNVGDQEFNQTLSERRAGRVVNHLQQDCRWAPYRMLTPAGMAESDPLADNTTPAGRAQNRRVAVHIMVSKAVEGL